MTRSQMIETVARKTIGFKFCDIGFGFGGYDQNFCIFFFYGFAYLFYIFIAG